MKKPYCCDASRAMYKEYYGRQNGGSMPVFAGARMQRGHGLGNILSSLFRKILPFFKQNVKSVGVRALKTGMAIADDVLEGKSFKDSASSRVPAGIKDIAANINWQTGSGIRKRRISSKPKRRQPKRKQAVKRKRAPKRKRPVKRNHKSAKKRKIGNYFL